MATYHWPRAGVFGPNLISIAHLSKTSKAPVSRSSPFEDLSRFNRSCSDAPVNSLSGFDETLQTKNKPNFNFLLSQFFWLAQVVGARFREFISPIFVFGALESSLFNDSTMGLKWLLCVGMPRIFAAISFFIVPRFYPILFEVGPNLDTRMMLSADGYFLNGQIGAKTAGEMDGYRVLQVVFLD